MAVDDNLIERFNEQIRLLENIKLAVDEAIDRARGRLKRIKAGEDLDQVFRPE